jgi:antitoxin HicB
MSVTAGKKASVPSAKAAHPNEGSSLEDFLHETNNYQSATIAAIKRVIAWQLREEMARSNVTKTEMAKRMDTSRAQLDRVLSPDDSNVTLETLQRAAMAVGRSLKLELT